MADKASTQQAVSLSDLPLPQLKQVKTQLEEELNFLTTSYAKLRKAQATFRECKNSAAALTPAAKDTTTLVPLTTSLYVPGKLSDIEHVLVDLGTGYYLEKTTQDAIGFYQDKCDYVQKSLDKLQETITEKQNNLQSVVNVMKYRLAQQAQSEDKGDN
ncbi:subunit of tubulin prefoldin [Dispira parvispora]|uniref:Subunit of tubulin prefoldin n=1 Tax=Dispira parvispora TaxID=1520584 RepID=A0A9W8AVC0_9FUNG|nr:subunit of tubulin prefoldin [Dispira parvispora]